MMNLTLAILSLLPQQGDLAERLKTAYVEAADGLVRLQMSSGAWPLIMPDRQVPSVAYTALTVRALSNASEALRPKYAANVDKGIAFILAKANPDGSFGEGDSGTYMKTYATAVALSALSCVPRSERIGDAIRGAQAYLKRNQLKEGPHKGGLGYGDEEPKRNPDTGEFEVKRSTIANLSATAAAAEAMKDSGLSLSDEFWPLVVEFVRKCQNNSETNTDPALLAAFKEKGKSVGNDGSAFYTPVPDGAVQKAGTRKVGDRETIVGYGSMTYDAIKTYVFAGLRRDSPEVKTAVEWVRRNYTLDTHPGFDFNPGTKAHLRGLYYYYLVMARALDACGERPLMMPDGRTRDWPVELGEQFLKTMGESKSWRNDNPAWYEGDPVLVTGYVLNVLDLLLRYVR
ncbi:MAG: terpene cyclase/mutase family protein [Planctomycetes bacterium]|nr:terpene cyclase/mutase family protein [Planctomycetota bacterium]